MSTEIAPAKPLVRAYLSAKETATLSAFLAPLNIASVSLVLPATEIDSIRSLNDAPRSTLPLLAGLGKRSVSCGIREGAAECCGRGFAGEKVDSGGGVEEVRNARKSGPLGEGVETCRGRRASGGRGEEGGGEAERGRRRWGVGFERGLEGRPGGRMLLRQAPANSDEFILEVEGRLGGASTLPRAAPVAGPTTAASSSRESVFAAFEGLRSALRRSPPESLNGPLPPLSCRAACARSRARCIRRPSGAIRRGSGGVTRVTRGGERRDARRERGEVVDGDDDGGGMREWEMRQMRQMRQLQVGPGHSAVQRL